MDKKDIPHARQELRYSIAIHTIDRIVSELPEYTELLIHILQAVYDYTQLIGEGAKVNTGQIKTSCAITNSVIYDLDHMERGLRILNALGLIERVGVVIAICQAGKEVMEAIYILAEQKAELRQFIRPTGVKEESPTRNTHVKLRIVKP